MDNMDGIGLLHTIFMTMCQVCNWRADRKIAFTFFNKLLFPMGGRITPTLLMEFTLLGSIGIGHRKQYTPHSRPIEMRAYLFYSATGGDGNICYIFINKPRAVSIEYCVMANIVCLLQVRVSNFRLFVRLFCIAFTIAIASRPEHSSTTTTRATRCISIYLPMKLS